MAEKQFASNAELERVKELLGLISSVALQGMAGTRGGDFGRKGLEKALKDIEAPWDVEALQEHTFRTILKLAGDAWTILNEAGSRN